MFARRAFCSAAIPPRMYGSLHIQSAAHAQRMLPSFVALPSIIGRQAALGSGLAVAPSGGLVAAADAMTEISAILSESALVVCGGSTPGRFPFSFAPIAESMTLRVVTLPICMSPTKDMI